MDHKDQERMVKELEVAIERLQALYNQYFMGIEKLEPTIPKKTVERKFNELRKIKFYNTALRFRFQSQVQKYSTHMTHWRRVCRQIEEGTYKRDIMRAKARTQQAERVEQVPAGELREEQEAPKAEAASDGLPVFDLEEMFNEVEDAFEQGFSLDAQLDAITAVEPPRSPQRDMVEPVGSAGRDDVLPGRSSGIPIPVSSLKASRKTDEARAQTVTPGAMQSRFRSSKGSRQSSATGTPKPPPPTSQRAAAPPPPPPPGTSPRKPPPPPAKRPPASSSNAGSGPIDDQKIRSVYRAYVTARKKTNEGTDNINLQKIATLLKKTENAKGGVSDFKVVIRNGKAVIKAVK